MIRPDDEAERETRVEHWPSARGRSSRQRLGRSREQRPDAEIATPDFSAVSEESGQFLQITCPDQSGKDASRTPLAETESGGNTSSRPRLGPYVLSRKIGQGGFSDVYAAYHQQRPDQMVAVKAFRNHRFDSQQRLQLEILVLSQFHHPNLVAILDAGETELGTPYLVMELIEGLPLDQYLKQQTLEFRQVAQLFREVSLAVAHAHERDVVHRDIKPTNIMVRSDGRPVVIDFGLAKRLNLSDLEQSLTASHAVVGTLGFLAPEQADTKQREITRSVDVYGLGATLYFALTGRPPLRRGEFYRALEELRQKPPERLRKWNPAIPRDLELICLKCLEKSPTDRYRSLQAVADDLQRFIEGKRIQAQPSPWYLQQWRWCQANPTVASLLALVGIAISAGLVSTATLWRQADHRWRESQVLLAQARDILKWSDRAAEEMLLQTPGALEYRHERLKQSLEFRRRLNEVVTADQTNWRSVAVTHFLLGKICCLRGLYAEAHENFLSALAIFQTLADRDPDNAQVCFDVFHSHLGLDQTTRQLGFAPAESFEHLEQALELIERLVSQYPDDKHYRDALACNRVMLGGRVYADDPVLGMAILKQAHQEALELKRRLPEPCLEWRHVGTSAVVLAEFHLQQHDGIGARDWAQVAWEATVAFSERPNPEPSEILDLATCQLLLRKVALFAGDQASADDWATQWRNLIDTAAHQHPDYFAFRDIQARAEEILAVEVPAERSITD